MRKKQIPGMLMLAALALAPSCCSSSKTHAAGAPADHQAAIEAIMTRTSVREYTPDTVSAQDVETMLRAAMAAPTAVNSQPWRFVVITDRDILQQLADSIGSMYMAAQAPVAVAVCGDLGSALKGDGRDFWIQDCSAATENLLVAANALGLGAVWCGVFPVADKVAIVRGTLGLPDDIVPLCVVPIGHPAGKTEPKDKWKPENIHYNTWR